MLLRNWQLIARNMWLLGSIALSGCLASPCVNREIARSRSPDERYDAVTFVRKCGATTRPSTQVSIVRAGDPSPAGKGNAYRAFQEIGLFARWVSPNHLALEVDTPPLEDHQESELLGVQITVADLQLARLDSVVRAPIPYTQNHLRLTADLLLNAASQGVRVNDTLATFFEPEARRMRFFAALDAWGHWPRLAQWEDSFALTSAGPDSTFGNSDDIRHVERWNRHAPAE